MAVILGAHATLFLVDAGLLVLQARGLPGFQVAALHALGDAVLLVLLALVDGWIGTVGGRLGKDDGRGKSKRYSNRKRCKLHGKTPLFSAPASLLLPELTNGMNPSAFRVLRRRRKLYFFQKPRLCARFRVWAALG